ncbi:hypothetical protein JCM8097_000408 [Rhodosporidiobolus ruineniae]
MAATTASPVDLLVRSTPSPSFSSSASRPPSHLPPIPPRPRTVLPPLSSLSLPGSPVVTSVLPSTSSFLPPSPPPSSLPELQHPRPQYPPRRASQPGPLLAPPPGPIPAPEVYARAYEMLRERWAGAEGDITRKVADAASAALETQTRKRRSRSWEESVLEAVVEEEGGEEGARKRSKLDDLASASIAFFDNPAPLLPPAPSTGRHRSTEPAPAAAAAFSSFPSSAFTTRLSLGARKRSFSLPPSPAPTTGPHCHQHHHHHHPPNHRHTISLSSSLPASRSSPHLSFSAFASPPTGHSLSFPSVSTGGTGGAAGGRSEALLHVVKSFEAVLACRAEGWRRLAARGGPAVGRQ